MKAKYFIGIIGLIATLSILLTSSFAQNCVVSQKGDKSTLIVSCPDGSRTVDAGGRADLYRVGDRIDIYGLSGNQPAPPPGGAQSPGIRSGNQQEPLPSGAQSPGRR